MKSKYTRRIVLFKNERGIKLKYFIGPTYRTSMNEELGGYWIFRSVKNFNPWKDELKNAEKIKQNIEEWIKTNGMLFQKGKFILLTTVRDRLAGSRKTGYAELETRSETKISLELNKTVPWIWKRKMAFLRVKFNFKVGYWEIDMFKWETDINLIQMEIDESLKTENEIKSYYENKVKQMDECVRK